MQDDPVLVLGAREVRAQPGDEVRVQVTVRNPSRKVERYAVQIIGDPVRWSPTVLPNAELRLLPYKTQTLEVVMRVPADTSTTAGSVPFAVRCASLAHADRQATEEGEIQVGAVGDLAVRIVPSIARGRWKGRYLVEVENHGNTPLRAGCSCSDPEEALSFAMAPESVDVPPGGRREMFLKVRPRRPMLRGDATPHSFTLTATDFGRTGTTAESPGTFEQRPILSKLVLVLGVLAVVGIAALIISSARGGEKSREDSTAPFAPELASAVPISDDSVQLTWGNDPTVTGWKLVVTGHDGLVFGEPREVAPEKNNETWSELTPQQNYCFTLIALKDTAESAGSEAVCATTLASASSAPPGGVAAEPEGNLVHVRWEALPGATSYSVVDADGIERAKVDAPNVVVEIEAEEAGEYCYRVLAIFETGASPYSEPEACIDVGGGGGSGTASELEGAFVVLHVAPIPLADPVDAKARAEAALSELANAGVTDAQIASTEDTDRLPNEGGDFLYVVTDGFETSGDATTNCQAWRARQASPTCSVLSLDA